MLKIKNNFQGEEEKRAFVDKSEQEYKKRIVDIAKKIAADNPRFILLSGPTCSGKTTTSNIISSELKSLGHTAKIISIDDFYLDRETMRRKNPDIESAAALDLNRFYDCVEKISHTKPVLLPKFDFGAGKVVETVPYEPKKGDIIIFEGIQALYPEIIALFPKNMTKTMYLGFFDDIDVGGVVFAARETRFYRRIIRDVRFRGSDVDGVIDVWGNVVANEDKNIIPYAKNTDYFANTFLEYELFVINGFLMNQTEYISDSAKALKANLDKKFEKMDVISPKYVPADSMFREFIGK